MTMRCGSLAFLIFSLVTSLVQSNVADRTKSTELRLENLTKNVTWKNVTEIGNKGKEKSTEKTLKSDNYVYMDDVLFALKSLSWSKEEEPCFNKTLQLLYGLRNFTLWAVWDWDSISSEPEGLLYGSRYQLGNFDECMHAPWSKTHPELKTQYCLADILLERTDRAAKKKVLEPYDPYQSALDIIQYQPANARPLNELTWGGCVPAVCEPRSVERLLKVMIARSHLGSAGMRPRINVTGPCQRVDEARPYDGPFFGFIAMVLILVTLNFIGTFLNSRRNEDESPTLGGEIIKSLCIKTNAQNLLIMKKEGIEVFYGIRFFSICLIVISHQVGFLNGGPVINAVKVERDMHGAIGYFVLHNDLFVDSFFMLSGFLVMKTFIGFKRFPNPVALIIRRYIRLAVALSIITFYMSAVFAYTGSGPLWPQTVAAEEGTCRKNWWLNLLMLSNYINTDEICMVTSWYIPCDFHYLVVTVLVYWLYEKSPFFGSTCALAFILASIVIPGYVHYTNNLPGVQLFTYDFVTDPRNNEQFSMTYIKSHTRAAAYIVGLICGYIFMRYKDDENVKRIPKLWSILGFIFSVALMLIVMFTGSLFYESDDHSLVWSAIYGALNRPAWAFGVGLMSLCCSLGYVPYVQEFLAWYPWAPLSRLAYGIYLTHSPIITRNVFVTRTPLLNDYFEIINNTCGTIVVSGIASLLIFLLAEAPINNLIQLYFTRSYKNLKKIQTISINPEASTSNANKQLQANLPSNIEFLSKI